MSGIQAPQSSDSEDASIIRRSQSDNSVWWRFGSDLARWELRGTHWKARQGFSLLPRDTDAQNRNARKNGLHHGKFQNTYAYSSSL